MLVRIETDKRKCKDCGETKDRTFVGKFENSKDKKFIDADGGTWCGRLCPDCHRKKTKKNMRSLRGKKNDTSIQV